jgi:putative CocE/NonD family hydrolase
MSLLDILARRIMKLRKTALHPVSVHRDLKVRMPDGAELLTDHYFPKDLDKPPVVLVRSPYGKSVFMSSSMAKPFAERGFQVVLQCCRGTGGSSGIFDPHHDERADGLATLDWIKAQAWYGGAIVTYGLSYLGYTQWAVARDAGPEVKAMAMQVTLSSFARMTYAGDSLMLENALSWTKMVTGMKRPWFMLGMLVNMLLRIDPIRKAQWNLLPLDTLDEKVVGERIPFWQDWMRYSSAEDPWWKPMDFGVSIAEVTKPITMIAGWYDIFAPWQLADFQALQEAGRSVRITVGPWRHTDRGIGREGVLDALDWFHTHLSGSPSKTHPKPVRVYVIGADEWRFFDAWPPREAKYLRVFLQPGFGLADSPRQDSSVDTYHYDPKDPTPSVGGPSLAAKPFAVDNRALEARSDVLSYTGASMLIDVDVIGPISAELYVSSTAQSADFFVRLCDVDPTGASRNVCDGLQRAQLLPGGAPQRVLIQLWPTAYRFKPGHCMRVQISSGAFPRWARNLGGGAELGPASECHAAQQSIYHDVAHPSSILLPTMASRAQ